MDGGSSVFTFQYSILEIFILGYSVTSTADEGSFSSARRLKTWLRSRTGDERFSKRSRVGHKLRPDSVSIADVAQDFVSRHEKRKTRTFGTAGKLKKWQS